MSTDTSTWVTKVTLKEKSEAISHWQAKFRFKLSQAVGFVSLEILAPSSKNLTWTFNQRFESESDLNLWIHSSNYKELLNSLAQECGTGNYSIFEEHLSLPQNSVTEVYTTFVDPEKISSFNEWHEKIHQIESKFPGFEKVYVQAPPSNDKKAPWITLVQFDSSTNLENWLQSPERAIILKESEAFIISRSTQKLFSSFGEWFDRINTASAWKQGMLILAVLFPIVMLQDIYLAPYINLPPTTKTFILNVICVTFLTWPMIPFIIFAFKWWLKPSLNLKKTLLGIVLLILVYGIEVFLFYQLLSR